MIMPVFAFRSLAAEWGKYGMRFNAIAPGPIETKVLSAAKSPYSILILLCTLKYAAKYNIKIYVFVMFDLSLIPRHHFFLAVVVQRMDDFTLDKLFYLVLFKQMGPSIFTLHTIINILLHLIPLLLGTSWQVCLSAIINNRLCYLTVVL